MTLPNLPAWQTGDLVTAAQMRQIRDAIQMGLLDINAASITSNNSDVLTKQQPLQMITASGTPSTVAIDAECDVIHATADGVELTLDFGAPSSVAAGKISYCFVFVNAINGGTVKFKMDVGNNWINDTVPASNEYIVDEVVTVSTRLFNSTTQGGILQRLPLETNAFTDADKLKLDNKVGFADYNDATTVVTPINVLSDTWTTVTNDGAGAFTNLSYLPYGTTRLLDTLNGEFLFDELPLGSFVNIRNDFTVTPSTNNAILSIRYVLGTGAGEYTLETLLGRLDSGSGIPYRFSLKSDLIYMGDTNTRDNPVKFQIRVSTPSTLVNSGTAIGVSIR
jgi:hypothetical protein